MIPLGRESVTLTSINTSNLAVVGKKKYIINILYPSAWTLTTTREEDKYIIHLYILHQCIFSPEDTETFRQGVQVLLTAHLHMDALNEEHTSASSLEYIEQMVVGQHEGYLCTWL